MTAASVTEIGVEDCRDVTHERLSSLRHGKNIGIQPHHAIPVACGEQLCLIPHGMAHLAETVLQFRKIDRKIAHQPLDDVRAQMILLRQFNALDDGKTALARHTLIFPVATMFCT